MHEDLISLSPDELNSYLMEEVGVGLYPLAHLLFEVIREPVTRRKIKITVHGGWFFYGWHPSENRHLTKDELKFKFAPAHRRPPEYVALTRAGLYPVRDIGLDRENIRLLREKIVTLRKKVLDTIAEIEVRRKSVV